MTIIELEIPIIPVPWAAAKITRYGATSPRWKEKRLSINILKKLYTSVPILGYVQVEFVFILPIPKSASDKRRKSMLDGSIRPTKCDTTNLQKFAEDCIKNILITDDRNVVKIISEKIYGLRPKTLVRVEPYQNEHRST